MSDLKARLVHIARTMTDGDSITFDAPIDRDNAEHREAIFAAEAALAPGLVLSTEANGELAGRKWWAERQRS